MSLWDDLKAALESAGKQAAGERFALENPEYRSVMPGVAAYAASQADPRAALNNLGTPQGVQNALANPVTGGFIGPLATRVVRRGHGVEPPSDMLGEAAMARLEEMKLNQKRPVLDSVPRPQRTAAEDRRVFVNDLATSIWDEFYQQRKHITTAKDLQDLMASRARQHGIPPQELNSAFLKDLDVYSISDENKALIRNALGDFGLLPK